MIKFRSVFLPMVLVTVCACSSNHQDTAGQDSNLKKQLIKDSAKAETDFKQQQSPSLSLVGKPLQEPGKILKSFEAFWEYYTHTVQLDQDYSAFDLQGNPITKEKFLQQLSTGKFYPLAFHSRVGVANYKLQKLGAKADMNISNYMSIFAKQQLVFLQLIGKPVPKFSFKDINGKLYTSENTKGKTIAFKCWFISCVPCVKEFPALNKLVQSYKNNPNVLFISLAIDGQKELKQFLSKTPFDYQTVANQREYMEEHLFVTAYPTHFLINKKGILTHVLADDVHLAEELSTELARQN